MKSKMKKLVAGFAVLLMTIFMFVPVIPAQAATQSRVVDEAGLLTSGEVSSLESLLDEISERQNMDIVVATVNGFSQNSVTAAADDFFDYNGYGLGDARSGLVLYICMGTRDWWISTRGNAIYAFTDAGIQYIGDKIGDGLSSGNYASAFTTYAELCDDFINQANNGKPYDVGNLPKGSFPAGKYILYSLIVGLVIALIQNIILRGELKSVAANDKAANYIVKDSMHVNEEREIFLYSKVESVKRESSSGGSSTHTSSSGATHGGGGGKF